MKKTVWLFLGVLVSINLAAQQPSATDAAAAQKAPPAKVEKKKASRPAIVEPAVTLSAGPATVTAKNVNVRAQATIYSEAIAQYNPGDTVTVIEQVNLDKFKPDEPRQWAKIKFPENLDVWIHESFIDRSNMTVIPDKLNVRAGPGENYSIVGVLQRGTTVKEVLTDGNWMRVSAPPDAYAFIAAMYLHQEAPAAPPAETPEAVAAATPAATSEPAAETPAPAAVEEQPAPETAAVAEPETEAPATAASDLMSAPPPTLQAEPVTPPPPRVVSHEGIVRPTVSIQAPTDFELADKETGKPINYLYSPTTNLDLSLYKGLRIVVTGEEGLDPRWTNTPVITIKRIHVIE